MRKIGEFYELFISSYSSGTPSKWCKALCVGDLSQ